MSVAVTHRIAQACLFQLSILPGVVAKYEIINVARATKRSQHVSSQSTRLKDIPLTYLKSLLQSIQLNIRDPQENMCCSI